MPKNDEMGFKDALSYLRKRYPKLSAWSLRNEVRNFPERFGAMRRNPIKKRGRGGRFTFTKAALDRYSPFTKA